MIYIKTEIPQEICDIDDELKPPKVLIKGKLKLLKRMHISIWFKKIHYSLVHKTLSPFKTL